MPDAPTILLVDDDPAFRSTMTDILELEGYGALPAGSRDEATAVVAGGQPFGAAVIDVQLPDGRGTELAAELHQRFPELPIVMVTGHGSMESAVEAMRAGSLDYMTKPVRPPALLALLEKAVARSARRDEEERLRERELRYRSLFDESPAAHAVFDAEGTIVTCNAGFAHLLGCASAADAANRPIGAYIRGEDRKQIFARLRREDLVRGLEIEMQRPDGSRVVALANLRGIRDEAGKVREIRAYVVDLTGRIELERRLGEAERMEVVGRLAGGIAHEFNNLLTVVQVNTEFLAEAVDDVDEEVQSIQKAVTRAVELTRDLLLFSQRDISQELRLDLSAELSDRTSFIREMAGPRTTVTIDVQAPDLSCEVDPSVLGLVLANLVRNAKDAMPEGGELSVTLSAVRLEPTDLEEWFGLRRAGPHVVLTVQDTGTGISPEIAERMFEPFYSTREGRTGLGLAAVFGAVTKGGGGLRVEPRPGLGARIHVAWPVGRG